MIGIGSGRFADTPIAGATLSGPALAAKHPHLLYRLDAHDKDGVMLGYLPAWRNGTYTPRINAPGSLKFDYPADSTELAMLVFPNEIYLRDQRGTIIHKFMPLKFKNTSGDAFVTVECLDIMHRMSMQSVDWHAAANTSVDIHLNKWFYGNNAFGQPYQEADFRVNIGKVDPAIITTSRSMAFQVKTLLQAVGLLHDTLWGYYYVDANGRFNWVNRLGRRTGQQLRSGKNVKLIVKEYDASNLVTKGVFYAQGRGLINARTKVTVSRNIATYGTIEQQFTSDKITNIAALQQWADNTMAVLSEPIVRYQVEIMDTSKAPSALDGDYDTIELGSTFRVVDANIGLDTEMQVIEVEYPLDFDRVMQVKATLADLVDDTTDTTAPAGAQRGQRRKKTPNIADTIAKIIEDIEEMKSADYAASTAQAIADDTDATLIVAEGIEADAESIQAIADGIEADSTATNSIASGLAGDSTAINTVADGVAGEFYTGSTSETIPGVIADDVADRINNGSTAESFVDDLDIPAQGTETPEAVALSGAAAGSSDTYAPMDHVHQGVPGITWDGASSAPTANNGTLMYNSGNSRYYARSAGAWLCFTHLEG